ncbi:CGNR zinc finger domain-containing protein [Ruminococcus flavefaciens]|uniref:CGNR zinc finger domain-containing protein n=1 Tax=Ruminococcus flavefaciens TaxID=1265 RepID=UPI000490330B|nr:CGNR zinc finger domain-containing protein [Ruminococcus flavefaciens]
MKKTNGSFHDVESSMTASWTGSHFRIYNHACLCQIESFHLSDNSLEERFLVTPRFDITHKYAYVEHIGLVMIDDNGTKISNDILSEILSVRSDSPNDVVEFVNKYGFLFNLPEEKLYIFKQKDIFDIILRLQKTIQLLQAVTESPQNLDTIFDYAIWLHYKNQTSIELGRRTYCSCIHTWRKALEHIKQFKTDDSILERYDYQEDSWYYVIPDSIYPPQKKYDYLNFEFDINGFDPEDYNPADYFISYPDASVLYRDTIHISPANRLIIEFTYHLTEILHSNSITSEVPFTRQMSINEMDKFDDNMKVGLTRFAKQTVKEEIDDALSHIKPSYDSDKMSAAWEIEHFITAIYFSIFYMNTNSQIYRKCANPSCECYFKVETTNNRKKYCSPECANATAQRRHRAKRNPKL